MENDPRDALALVDAARIEKRGGVTGKARIGALPRHPVGGATAQRSIELYEIAEQTEV